MNEMNFTQKLVSFYGQRYEANLEKKEKVKNSLKKFQKEFYRYFDIRRDSGIDISTSENIPANSKINVKEKLYASFAFTIDISYEIYEYNHSHVSKISYQFEIFVDFDKPDEYLFQSDISNNEKKVILSKEDIFKKIEEDLFRL